VARRKNVSEAFVILAWGSSRRQGSQQRHRDE